jgi:hypothetical protein
VFIRDKQKDTNVLINLGGNQVVKNIGLQLCGG